MYGLRRLCYNNDWGGNALHMGSNQNGARMTSIFSFTGFSGNGPSLTNRAAPSGQKTSARSQILDQLAAADPDKAAKAQEKLGQMQQALDQMQQMRQDMKAARKEAAKQKVARIKAQIQALKMMGGDAQSNARKLARLARELSSAVRDYKSVGGTDGTAGISAAPAPAAQTDKAAPAADALVPMQTQMTDPAAENTPAPAASTAASQSSISDSNDGQDDEDDRDGSAGTSKAASHDDDDFAKEVRKLRRQIEAMLEKEKLRMALEQGKPGNRDTRAADAALREVERQTVAIENPMPSINIQV